MTPEDCYRAIWQDYLRARTEKQRDILEKAMDRLQAKIATGPGDPKWQEFLKTMPQSYHDHWRKAHALHQAAFAGLMAMGRGRPN